MDALNIVATGDSPMVQFEPAMGRFVIAGKSMPEDPKAFYAPIIAWILNYAEAPNPSSEFVFKFDYLNTASSKRILDIVMDLRAIAAKAELRIRWSCYEGDTDMEETGEAFSEISGLPFIFESRAMQV
ncbi:MAG: DUF1987 domain-containing protein [Bacteroidales bacterium]|nr:DUF1987 domain-containing protein [Bacteroidales bacterium]